MIIQTRYRDIPWEEAAKCVAPADKRRGGVTSPSEWEAKYRGRPVQIEVPAVQGTGWLCQGPYFKIAGSELGVCPHIAEIGD